eukprot:CAMPEP_0180040728 /NCGR_PEP_ID=MMETSP0984-20121128/33651_1 /TAXON_ID=483367 /ORGANISM="non described non described, Strain CCMP 2436" /LENGTH=118 /DNA_ID=CAMNT_0021968061 /DNA_START=291 /DNA_END=644 /DNA_ORIENTATION=+
MHALLQNLKLLLLLLPFQPASLAAAGAARRGHLTLVGVLVEQLQCFGVNERTLRPTLSCCRVRQKLRPCAHVCWVISLDEHFPEKKLSMRIPLIGGAAPPASGLAGVRRQAVHRNLMV